VRLLRGDNSGGRVTTQERPADQYAEEMGVNIAKKIITDQYKSSGEMEARRLAAG
jgi:hypothetical protein